MNVSQKILSDITIFNKYAKYVPSNDERTGMSCAIATSRCT